MDHTTTSADDLDRWRQLLTELPLDASIRVATTARRALDVDVVMIYADAGGGAPPQLIADVGLTDHLHAAAALLDVFSSQLAASDRHDHCAAPQAAPPQPGGACPWSWICHPLLSPTSGDRVGWIVAAQRNVRRWRDQDRAHLAICAAILLGELGRERLTPGGAVGVGGAGGAGGTGEDLRTDVDEEGEVARLGRMLQRARDEFEFFASVASHDLRAPLRGIRFLLDQLEVSQHQEIDVIRRRLEQMEALIDGVRLYSRAGLPGGEVESVELHDLIDEICRQGTADPDPRLRFEGPLTTLRTQRLPLRQALEALVRNALRYVSADGTVRVACRALDERLVEFTVVDNGPGVPLKHQERVWRLFQTLEGRDEGAGAGLGLSITRKIVEDRGGEVRLESTEGLGATFFFTWPRGA